MRRFLLLLALSVATPAFADPTDATPAPATKKVKHKEVKLTDINIDGHRDVPVAVVMTRDQSVKQELNKATDEHLHDAATGH